MAHNASSSFISVRNVATLDRSRSFKDFLDQDNRSQYYRFRLLNRSSITSTLDRLTKNANLTLLDSDFNQLAASRKGGNKADSISSVLDAGVYFVRIDRKAGDTNYRLRIAPGTAPDQGGNDLATASALTVGATPTTIHDALDATDTNDFYRIDVSSFGNLNLSLDGLSADANIQLLNNAGTVLRLSTAGGTTPEAIQNTLQPGTYYVKVFPGNSGANTTYTLNATFNPLRMVGLANNNSLVSFTSGNTSAATAQTITGLATGETLLGIDFRPATGQLYGLGSTNRLYTIDPTTGVATSVGTAPFAPLLNGTSFGFDFNPAVDRIRVVSDNEQNLRLNPDTGAIAGVDAPLNPAGNVVASAYTNNRFGITQTTLFGIDSVNDTLVRQGGVNGSPSPNGGVLTSIGALGADFNAQSGFDIFTDINGADTGFAVSGSTLYNINLTSGAASGLGNVTVAGAPVTLIGLAVSA